MSDTIAIVTDSISCLPKELIERYRIEIVPIRLLVRGQVYRDLVDVTPTQAYEMLLEDPEKFSTSPSSPGHYLEAFTRVSQWATGVLCITLSSKLSMGFRSATMAMEEAKTEMPEFPIVVMDSINVTAAEGFITLAAAREAEKGSSLEQVIKAAEEVRDKVSFYALLETIEHVYRTGRIPKIASQIGSRFGIKPLLTGVDGLIKFKGIVNTREKGIQKLMQILRDHLGDSPSHVAIMHAVAPNEAEDLKKRIAEEFNCVELWISEFTPVMGYATGTGTLAIAFYKE